MPVKKIRRTEKSVDYSNYKWQSNWI